MKAVDNLCNRGCHNWRNARNKHSDFSSEPQRHDKLKVDESVELKSANLFVNLGGFELCCIVSFE
jgi:hypothetical protein